MEKDLKRIYICICTYIYMCVYIYIYIHIKLNQFAVHQKLTQHCKSTILQLKRRNDVHSQY